MISIFYRGLTFKTYLRNKIVNCILKINFIQDIFSENNKQFILNKASLYYAVSNVVVVFFLKPFSHLCQVYKLINSIKCH